MTYGSKESNVAPSIAPPTSTRPFRCNSVASYFVIVVGLAGFVRPWRSGLATVTLGSTWGGKDQELLNQGNHLLLPGDS